MARIKVEKWLLKGQFDGKENDSNEILDDAGQLLDDSYSHEILGQNLFQSPTGKFYQVQVQAVIVPLTKDEANQIIEDHS